jgi:hypothetical protein
VNVGQLRGILRDWPPQTQVTVRTIEKGEVCLTVDLTSADQHDAGNGAVSLLLVGDVDEASEGRATRDNEIGCVDLLTGEGVVYYPPGTKWVERADERGVWGPAAREGAPPRCTDGGRNHDMRGQSRCPQCGFEPALSAPPVAGDVDEASS